MRYLTATLILALLAAAGSASANHIFADPVGDASGAPDVTSVAVTTSSTKVTFTIHTTSAEEWTNSAAILDINAGGTELMYVLHSLHDNFTLDKTGEQGAHTDATANLSGATLTIVVPLAELGGAQRIGFRVSTPGPTGEDRAPDASLAPWQYSLAPSISFTPAAPVHGKTFAAHVPAGATCRATVGKTLLRGACRWRIPAGAAGKRLAVVVTSGGAKKTYSFRVR